MLLRFMQQLGSGPKSGATVTCEEKSQRPALSTSSTTPSASSSATPLPDALFSGSVSTDPPTFTRIRSSSISVSLASTSSQGSSASESKKELGVTDYITIARILFNHRKALGQKIIPLRRFLKIISSRIKEINQQAETELLVLYPEKKEKGISTRQNLSKFLSHFSEFFAQLDLLTSPSTDTHTSEIIEALVLQVSNLIDEFELLNPEATLDQYIPESVDQLKEKISIMLEQLIATWMPKIESEAGSTYAALWQNLDVEEFKKLPSPAQQSVLVGMDVLLSLYKNIILLLDKVELQFGFKEGVLLEILTQKPVEPPLLLSETSEHTTLKKPSDYTRMVLGQFARISGAYPALIRVTGYLPIENFPFDLSKNKAREEFRQEIQRQLAKQAGEYKQITTSLTKAAILDIKARSAITDTQLTRDDITEIKLPDKTLSLEETHEFKAMVFAQYKILKTKLHLNPKPEKTSKSKQYLTEEQREQILAPYEKALKILGDLEFYLCEQERIQKIVAPAPTASSQNPIREFKTTKATDEIMRASMEVVKAAQPFFQPDSGQRKKLERIQQQLKTTQGHIQATLDPILIEEANKQFTSQPQELKTSTTTEAKFNSDTSVLDCLQQLVVVPARLLHSIDILLQLTSPSVPDTDKKLSSPSADLADSIRKSSQIIAHASAIHTTFDKAEALFTQNTAAKDFVAQLETRLKDKFQSTRNLFSSLFRMEQKLENPERESEEKQPSLQIGNIKLRVNSKEAKLINEIEKGIHTLGMAFLGSYADFLNPPTTWTHIKTTGSNFSLIITIFTNIDHLADLIKGNQVATFMQYFYYFNQLLKTLFIIIDEFEILFCLKQGTVFSFLKNSGIDIHKGIEELNEIVTNNRFEFPDTDRYPYKQAILQNRTSLLEENKSPITQKITQDRISNDSAIRESKEKPPMPSTAPSLICLQERLDELGREDKVNASTTKKTKMRLLQILNVNSDSKYEESKEHTPEEAANKLDSVVKDHEGSELLFEGRTRGTMRQLCDEAKDRFAVLEMAIDSLKQQRHQRVWSRSTLERRIAALEEFRALYRKPGYFSEDAAKELMEPKWRALLAEDRVLMTQLSELDNKIPAEQRQKKPILFPPPKPEPSLHEAEAKVSYQIDGRIKELKANYQTRNNLTKQRLLNALKSRMLEHAEPFQIALQHVREKNPADHYLLWDGDTGKMMRYIEHRLLTREQIIARIDREIMTLREHYFKPYFFRQYRIRQTAEAIAMLKQYKQDPDKKLDETHRNRLRTIAPDLLEILECKRASPSRTQ